jgi:hypothetical protein
VRPLVARFRDLYGAGPLHLLVLLAALLLAGWTVLELGLGDLFDPDSWWQSIAVWFVGAALVHDLLLFPAYALGDRLLTSRTGSPHRIPLLNHVRVPLLATGLTFLVFFPGIVQQGSDAHLRASGLTQEPYLERWLLLIASFFVLSGIAFGVRLLARVRQVTPPPNRSGHEPDTNRVG